MQTIQLRAEDAKTGLVIGWRRGGQVVTDRNKATTYVAPNAALAGIETAEARWPDYKWRFFRWRTDVEVTIPRRPKPTYTRDEVAGLLFRTWEDAAVLCEGASPDWTSQDYAAAMRSRREQAWKALK